METPGELEISKNLRTREGRGHLIHLRSLEHLWSSEQGKVVKTYDPSGACYNWGQGKERESNIRNLKI